jgi:glycosyltransferase involved in cell wall biosynthesis
LTPALQQKFGRSVSLLAWGLNEEILLEDFLDRAFALLTECVEDFEVIFVDDGSTDQTPEILKAYAAKEPRLRVITNEVNLNIGQSSRRAIAAATKEIVFWQTVDWSYDIRNFRIFLELTKYFDVVQGVRPLPIRLLSYIPVLRSIYRVRTRSDNFRKAIVSLGNYYVLRTLFGVPFHDFQNITFYPTKLLQSVELTGDSSFINPECLLRTYERGTTYLEVPIPFIPRTAGVAKGTKLSSIWKSIRDILKAWLNWGWRQRRNNRHESSRHIFRVWQPFNLDEKVIELTAPLFKEFR